MSASTAMRSVTFILAICLAWQLVASSPLDFLGIGHIMHEQLNLNVHDSQKEIIGIDLANFFTAHDSKSEPIPVHSGANKTASTKNTHNVMQNIEHGLDNCPPGYEVTYTAAVLEYEPYTASQGSGLTGENVIIENVRRISDYARAAKELGADIFVSPEYGVTSLPSIHTDDTEFFLTLTQTIPEPALGVVPCLDHTLQANFEAVRELSCSARNLSMYLVADLAEQTPCEPSVSDSSCPKHGLTFYNTQVVFDRTGAVVAKYRKQNLYLEDMFTPGPRNDSFAVFDTDFGVRFTLQICFDLTSLHPGYSNVREKGIRDVVMSTAWVDELPFLLAINLHNGWSSRLGANLLVSGYHWPEHTKLGSGIYRSYSGLAPSYTYDPNSGDVLVVAPVTTCRTETGTRGKEEQKTQAVTDQLKEPKVLRYPRKTSTVPKRRHVFLHDDLSVYNSTVLQTTQKNERRSVSVCHADGLCCHLRYEHSNSDLVYQLLAFSGVLVKGGGVYNLGAQICGITWCITEDTRTCGAVDFHVPEDDEFGPFEMEAGFVCEEVYNSAMTRDLRLVPNGDINYNTKSTTHVLKTEKPTKNLLAAALLGRWYSNDP